MSLPDPSTKNFIQLAADAAATLRRDHQHEPQVELLLWLHIAQRREAMVSQVYDPGFVWSQLSRWQEEHDVPDDVVAAAQRALAGVWAQEAAHQAYFTAILNSAFGHEQLPDEFEKMWEGMRGKVEGRVLRSRIATERWRRHLARVAITIGRAIMEVPPYVESLREVTFSEFCEINGDLEQTAVSGYNEMLVLTRRLKKSGLVAETQLVFDLTRTLNDERYHEALFRSLARWPPPPGGPHARPSGAPAYRRNPQT